MVVFIIIGAVGLMLLLVSAVFGELHEFAAEHEISVEHGEVDVHDTAGESSPSPFSFRVIALFATTFGFTGALVRYFDCSYFVSSLAGVVAGLVIGYLGWHFLKVLYRQQADSSVKDAEMVGLVGQVTTPIPCSGIGQVCLEVKGQRRYLSARSKDGQAISDGISVKIAECPGGSAVVEKLN